MDAKLVVVSGKVNKKEVRLKLPTIIGRSRSADLTVAHPLVSRQHCLIYERDGALVVKDNGSLNGTFVAGSRISECILKPGDKLTVGPLTFVAIYDHQGAFPELTSTSVSASTVQEFVAEKRPARPADEPEIDFGAPAESDHELDFLGTAQAGEIAEDASSEKNEVPPPLRPDDFAVPAPAMTTEPAPFDHAAAPEPAQPEAIQPAAPSVPALPEASASAQESPDDFNWLEQAGASDGVPGVSPVAEPEASSGIGLPIPRLLTEPPAAGAPQAAPSTASESAPPMPDTSPPDVDLAPAPDFLAALSTPDSPVPETTLDFTFAAPPQPAAASATEATIDLQPSSPSPAKEAKTKQKWWPFSKKKEQEKQPGSASTAAVDQAGAPAPAPMDTLASPAPGVEPSAAPGMMESLEFATVPEAAAPVIDDKVAAWLDDSVAAPPPLGQDNDLDDFLKNLGNKP